jgi:hypothetical protein
MRRGRKLLAWIEPHADGEFVAAFAEAGWPMRPPAMRLFGSADQARQWVEAEAVVLALPVKWIAS